MVRESPETLALRFAMDARQRRLKSDLALVRELCAQSNLIEVETVGNSSDRLLVRMHCRGLMWLPGSAVPSITTEHRCEVSLHSTYPRFPPRIQWLTEIFHPNILPPSRNGGVCIGRWSPSETLDRLLVRICEMVQYKNYSTSDALNLEAAAWAERNRDSFPVDHTAILLAESTVDVVLRR